jgi:hypothetical protein
MARPLFASALVYFGVTLLIGREVLATLSTALIAGIGDAALNAAILTWNARHVPGTEAWFDFPAFYPATDALTFSEHLLGLSVVATPIFWLTGDAVTTYNVTLLATYVLCGVAMFALVWSLTGSGTASFLAGFAYAFAPYRVSQAAHIQMLAAFWAPLSLLGLHRFLELGRTGLKPRRRWPWLALFAVCWMLQGAANGYFLVFFSVLVGFWVLGFVLSQRRWRDAGMIAVAAALASLPLIPILLRFVEAHARYGLSRAPGEIASFSADVTSVVCAPPRLDVWGFGLSVCGGETELFPGVALVVLCAVAAWGARQPHPGRSRRHVIATSLSAALLVLAVLMIAAALAVAVGGRWRWELGPVHLSASSVTKPFAQGMSALVMAGALSPAVWATIRRASVPGLYLLIAALMWALSWGPSPRLYGKPALEHGPYAALLLLPGLDGLRVPARFWMMAVLCLCVAMGVLLAEALRRRKASAGAARTLAVIGAGLLALDGLTSLPAAVLQPTAPRPDLLRGGITLALPLGSTLDFDVAVQLDAIRGGWVAVNGYSGYEPPHYGRLREASRQEDAEVLNFFAKRSDLHVVVRDDSPRHIALVERQPGVEVVGAAHGLRQYRIPRQGTQSASEPTGDRLAIASLSVSCSPEKMLLAIDGKTETRWECGAQHAGQEVTVDLGTVSTVGMIVPALGRFTTDYPRHLVVETSVGGNNWEQAWDDGTLVEAFEAVVRDPRRTPMVIPFTPRLARYVRLRLMSRDDVWFWTITELEVWTGR